MHCGGYFFFAAAAIFPFALFAPQFETVAAGPSPGQPVAAVQATPTPTPIPPPPSSPFLGWRSEQLFSESNRSDVAVAKENRFELSGLDFEEQTLLLPPNSGALAGTDWLFQKRFSPFSNFMLMKKGINDNDLILVNSLRSRSFVVDSATLCPLTRQVLLLGPGIDANGKPIMSGKPRRLHVVSLDSGEMTLVWRMSKDDRGGIASAVSASPDCKHILVNLHLEKEGSREPYGRLVFLKGEVDRWGVFPESVVEEIKPGGASKWFAHASFALPQSSEFYAAQTKPPQVVAVREYGDGAAQRYRLDLLTPDGKGRSWKRQQLEVPKDVTKLGAPVFYNRLDAFSLLAEMGSDGNRRTGVAFVKLDSNNPEWNVILDGGVLRLMWAHLHPKGDRLVVSYVLTDKAAAKWTKPLPPAGIIEVFAGAEGKKSSYSLVESFLPFHALSALHNPRPQYSADGNRLLFTFPGITDSADAALFEPGAKVDESLQFHTSLIEWRIGGSK